MIEKIWTVLKPVLESKTRLYQVYQVNANYSDKSRKSPQWFLEIPVTRSLKTADFQNGSKPGWWTFEESLRLLSVYFLQWKFHFYTHCMIDKTNLFEMWSFSIKVNILKKISNCRSNDDVQKSWQNRFLVSLKKSWHPLKKCWHTLK